jgi:ferredoxin
MAEMQAVLASLGLKPGQIHAEIFNGGESLNPGVVSASTQTPHLPKDDAAGTGPLISFARSGIAAHWKPSAYTSILELAEACDVPVRWSCRTGVCHNCETGLISGSVSYSPDPLDPPTKGNILICCARPQEDMVIDI